MTLHYASCGNRGQMKIQQMAFVLMAITLFFVLVGLFILTYHLSGLKKEATSIGERSALLLVTRLANSPEFSCGRSFGGGKINCVDSDKLMILKDKAGYNGFWGIAEIQVRKIYPAVTEQECSLSNYPNCNKITVYTTNVEKGAPQSNFVTLCRKEISFGTSYDKCELAKILVSYRIVE